MTRQALLPDRVFDSINGQMLDNHVVTIAGDRVESITPALPDQEAQRLEGMTLVPGLIDVHTHLAIPLDNGHGFAAIVQRSGAQEALLGVKHAGETLRAGFTTVRDAGCWRAFTDVALRDSIDAGWVAGPRMAVAGAFVGAHGGAGDITGLAVDVDTVLPRELRFGMSSGADEYRSNTREILRYGADFIKVLATGAVLTSGTNPGTPEMTEEELRAVVETATEADTHVAAHAHGTEGIKRAIRAGARSIEHASLIDYEGIELMASHGTYMVADLYDGDFILEVGPAMGYTDEVMRGVHMTTDAQRKGFTKAVEAGVRIAFGTDAGVYPHGDNAKQLSLHVRYGMSPAAALQSATRWAAELMGWEDRVGSLTPGAFADLVVVDGNPLDDISTLETPAGVMQGGDWVVAPIGEAPHVESDAVSERRRFGIPNPQH
ncbi:MAG: amidohydrolase family protein [Actinomycetota bacterium]|nr:amidohydrolase family protein [Actinomycetota bacterium]